MLPVLTALALAAAPQAAPAAAAPAQAGRPFTAKELVTLKRVGHPRVSPDGKSVVFTLRETDLEANKGRTDLWLVPADGAAAPRALTRTPDSEGSPEWAPDGQSVFFTSGKGGSTQVWRLPVSGGEPVQVTKLPLDVGAFRLSPDGKLLAVALEVFPDCPTLECTTQRLAEREKSKATGRVYDEALVRHWDEWEDGRRNHLFVVPVDGSRPPVNVMQGMQADAPSEPFGGADEYTFTPDGTGLVFTARDVGREEAWSTDLDLFHVAIGPTGTGKAPPRKLTTSRGTDTGPVFSPDGKWLAYQSMPRAGYESDRLRVMVRGWPTGPEREVAPRWDRSSEGLSWSPDGKTLYTATWSVGQHPLFAIDVASGAVREVVKAGYATEVQVARDGRLVFAHDDLGKPADLHVVAPDGSAPKQLTRVNAEATAGLGLGAFEQFSFKGAGGDTVYGWALKPAGFVQGQKYPVAFLIHGGPQGSFGNHWHYRWNPQSYAARGYAVVMVDFHGSVGYGQRFTDAIRGDWGGKPLVDLQRGLTAATGKYPWMQADNVCALGASYGGYMINWIAGNWPTRFKCLVNHDGILDTRMGFFDTEELWFPEWEHKGTPWENPREYAKHNPVDHVGKWKTPMLVVHGGKDFRVVETHGLGTFNALQRKGIPSRLLYFPEENHWVLRPANSIQWHDEVLGWLDRWTRAPAQPPSR